MKHINEYLNEKLCNINEGEIKSEKDLRNAMEAKFKAAFKDDLDEEKMKETIDGFCDDHKQEIEDGKFDELIGEFNKSFAKKDDE